MSARMKAACSGKDLTKRLVNRDAKECANSVFHVPLPTPSCADCAEGLADIAKFADGLKQMCSAGTHTADKLSALLLGTSYQEIAGQFLLLQKQLDGEVEAAISQVKLDIDNFTKQLSRDGGSKGGKGEDDVKGQGHRTDDLQLVAMGLALMIQLQQQFFIMAAEKVAYFTQNHALNNVNGLSTESKLKPALPKEPSVHHVAGQNRSSSSSSSNIQETPAHVLKAAAKPSSGSKPPGTAWDRDCEREAGSSLDGRVLTAGQMSTGHIQADYRGQGVGHVAGGQSSSSHPLVASSQSGGGSVAPAGLVSEEEIDVVIDMLSRANKYTAPPGGDPPAEQPSMPVPINSNPLLVGTIQHPVLLSKAPGSQLSAGGQYTMNINNKDHPFKYGVRAAQHRQSDSFIVDCHINNEMKMNTWPIRPHMRDLSTSWQGSDGHHPGVYDPHATGDLSTHADVTFGCMAGGATKYPLLPGFSPGPWSTAPDSAVNKAWPVFPVVRDGDPIPTQWTGLADSSSCSDESSSNSDMQWIMGVNLMGVMNVKRRHSSGGDTAATSSGTHLSNINKSVDNLMESKSANTWPPKHPWNNKQCDSNATLDSGDGSMVKGHHKPLTPQWSDPLATRSLAVWDTGLTGSLSQQSFGSSSVGGADFKAASTVNVQDEEKCF